MSPITKADLHVHSLYSSRPSEWFLQRLGARESYTDPDVIYHEALARGMQFVTLTDHNEIEGSLRLHELHPLTTFTGIELTSYFPEDGCKLHVLVWGLTRAQFHEMNLLRVDIYQLRDYIRRERLAHAVAHATFSINKRLTLQHIERLFLLFDHFEAINGSRTRQANTVFSDALASLTPDVIDGLYRTYRIEPFSDTPWIKGLTAGTDDHSGLFIGKTYTRADAANAVEFLEALRQKRSIPCGRHNDFKGLAFAIYKIAYDYMRSRQDRLSTSLFGAINQYIFEEASLPLKNRFKIKRMRLAGGKKKIHRQIVQLIDACKERNTDGIETKIALVYEKIAAIADHLFHSFISGADRDVSRGDVPALIGRIAATIPAVFMSLPFFTTMNLLHDARRLLNDIAGRYPGATSGKKKKIVLFTDMSDENAAVDGMRSRCGSETAFTIALCRDSAGLAPPSNDTAVRYLILPMVFSYAPAFIREAVVKFPSILSSLKLVCEAEPDEIIVASPGPVGLLGLFASRLLHVPCSGIYREQYDDVIREAFGDDSILSYANSYMRWFFGMLDNIFVFDNRSMDQLARMGLQSVQVPSIATAHRLMSETMIRRQPCAVRL